MLALRFAREPFGQLTFGARAGVVKVLHQMAAPPVPKSAAYAA